jgi:hypothetical protein
MSRTHVLLRCPALEDPLREARVDNTTRVFTRPSSIGVQLGNPRWEKCLLKFLVISEAGKISPNKVDEIHRITRYDEGHNLVDEPKSEDQCDTALHDPSVKRATIAIRPRH